MAELSRDDELKQLAEKMGTEIESEIRIVMFENGFITFSTSSFTDARTSDVLGAMEVVKQALAQNVINGLVEVSAKYLGVANEEIQETVKDSPVDTPSPNEQGSSS